MDHNQATQLEAVEKYLLEELTPEVRDEFEEHYFDCQHCATDLRATAAFIDAAKKELKAGSPLVAGPVTAPKSRAFWPSALAWAALAASLLVIAYQNAFVYPHFKSEIAALQAPEILPTLSLAGGNSRGGQVPALAVAAAQPLLLTLDIPTEERFASYTCLLYAPSGSLSWRVEVSAQSAKDTVSIRVPAPGRAMGEYTLTVQGNTSQSSSENGVALAHYRFTLNSQN